MSARAQLAHRALTDDWKKTFMNGPANQFSEPMMVLVVMASVGTTFPRECDMSRQGKSRV